MKREQNVPITVIRQRVLYNALLEAVGKRIFLLSEVFPFMIVGNVTSVKEDFVFVVVQVAQSKKLENEIIRIKIDDIEVFYVEEDGPKIQTIS
ncbi:hypothetical protein ACFFHM_22340 [Halalkalibacter kiskunsagensis]|uniref:Uncharacterized protein n=1 Tax=Halalkalibacter kiskunsagensis TaxID=1548599 RepID=A0ABV6KMC1_9BACI